MAEKASGFWSGMPGILTGIAAVITALTGLYAVMDKNTGIPSADSVQVPDSSLTTNPTTAPTTNPTSVDADPVPEGTPSTKPFTPGENKPEALPELQTVRVVTAFPEKGPLLDCNLFPTVNTTASLMSWSNYYHKQIVAADGVKIRAVTPCNKTIDQRGMAHCKAPDDVEIRQALLETLQLCRAAGFEWQDIQHSTIIGK